MLFFSPYLINNSFVKSWMKIKTSTNACFLFSVEISFINEFNKKNKAKKSTCLLIINKLTNALIDIDFEFKIFIWEIINLNEKLVNKFRSKNKSKVSDMNLTIKTESSSSLVVVILFQNIWFFLKKRILLSTQLFYLFS